MAQNKEMRLAWEFIEHTGKSIFLTGKAGTGKTTFLKTVVQQSSKRSIVVAPTGVAAINAGGVTIHSFFQLPLSPFVPSATMKSRFDFSKEKRKILSSIDLLIIDEISMVRSDLLDAIDSVLRRFRKHDKPFGGVQLLMIGDLGQLTPVVTPDDEQMLRPYYDTPYFFGSHALSLIDYVTIQLEHVYRQQDLQFLTILNHIRDGRPTDTDMQQLNSRYIPDFQPSDSEGYIRLTTHNVSADRYNETRMEQLHTKPIVYKADVDGTFPEYAYPTAPQLTLKVGAQVMFIKNDPSAEHLYYNGRIGCITELNAGNVIVRCHDNGQTVKVEPQVWENTKYTLNERTKEIESKVVGTFSQMPLRLAWAITIHKSQGLTFNHAIIDAQRSFAPGQVYVALSRCRTMEGMVLSSMLTPSAVINDESVHQYINRQQEATTRNVGRLETFKDEYYRHLLMEMFDFNDICQYEEALGRVMIEYFSHAFSSLTTLHKQTMLDTRLKLFDIAEKWQRQIADMTMKQLSSEDVLDRVQRSATYFSNTLEALFEKLLHQTKDIKSNNKQAMKRLDNTFADLQLAYLARKGLLTRMAEEVFSVAYYLKAKQETLLDAMDMLNPNSTRKKRERKPKEPKPKKEPTQEVTLRMYRSGMLPELIAKERNLSTSTIYTHLASAVKKGEIPVTQLIDADKVKAINTAMAKAGDVTGLSPIKLLCPPDVTWEELRLVYLASR